MAGSPPPDHSRVPETMPDKNARQSISKRLALGLNLAIGLVSVFTFLILYYYTIHHREAELQRNADASMDYLVGALELPLWNFDGPVIESICQTLLQNDHVAGLALKDPFGKDILTIGKDLETKTFSRNAEFFHQGKLLGKVKVSFSRRFVQTAKRHLFFIYAAIMLVIFLTLNLFTLLLLKNFLQKPLQNLNGIVQLYMDGKYDSPITDFPYTEFKPFGKILAQMGKTINMQMKIQHAKETQILMLNRQLEDRITQRTSQLEATNKELEAFAYSVSHDLRAPLRHINGFMQLLREEMGTTLETQALHYMDAISRASRKMGALVDDLLSFSRMGRHTLLVEQVDINPLIQDVIREYEPDFAGRHIEWHINDLPQVTGDAAMLRMALDNLISNALKFTGTRDLARIEIRSEPGRNGETVICVRDNGVGFDMAYADKLFGVFQRLHRADEFEGTGIGLANVHRIITRHGGRVWAEAKPDQGAAFYFSLPRK